jgi:hypothetical protein
LLLAMSSKCCEYLQTWPPSPPRPSLNVTPLLLYWEPWWADSWATSIWHSCLDEECMELTATIDREPLLHLVLHASVHP